MFHVIATLPGITYVAKEIVETKHFLIATMKDDGKKIWLNANIVLTIHPAENEKEIALFLVLAKRKLLTANVIPPKGFIS